MHTNVLIVPRKQGATSTDADVDEYGFPETLDMGHLETTVRILAMLARGGCSSFEERLDTLLQVIFKICWQGLMISLFQ